MSLPVPFEDNSTSIARLVPGESAVVGASLDHADAADVCRPPGATATPSHHRRVSFSPSVPLADPASPTVHKPAPNAANTAAVGTAGALPVALAFVAGVVMAATALKLVARSR